MKSITYSIIIPQRNMPDLLQRCLDSIPRRDDIQIIVVDDNSDSDKVDFANFPGLNDPNVEVIFTKEGKGAGYARNMGLKKLRGIWLLFADADDYFTGNFLDYIDKYKNSDYDLIYFGTLNIDSETKLENKKNVRFTEALKKAIDKYSFDEYKYTAGSAMAPWAKMIKHALVKENNIVFDETFVANDQMFSTQTAYYAKNAFFDEYKIYIREMRSGSLMKQKTYNDNLIRFSVYVRVNAFLRNTPYYKYKKEMIKPLLKLKNIHNMEYFFKGIKVLNENNFCFTIEYFHYMRTKVYNKLNKLSSLRKVKT